VDVKLRDGFPVKLKAGIDSEVKIDGRFPVKLGTIKIVKESLGLEVKGWSLPYRAETKD
jgi:hypothetical protein